MPSEPVENDSKFPETPKACIVLWAPLLRTLIVLLKFNSSLCAEILHGNEAKATFRHWGSLQLRGCLGGQARTGPGSRLLLSWTFLLELITAVLLLQNPLHLEKSLLLMSLLRFYPFTSVHLNGHILLIP